MKSADELLEENRQLTERAEAAEREVNELKDGRLKFRLEHSGAVEASEFFQMKSARDAALAQNERLKEAAKWVLDGEIWRAIKRMEFDDLKAAARMNSLADALTAALADAKEGA